LAARYQLIVQKPLAPSARLAEADASRLAGANQSLPKPDMSLCAAKRLFDPRAVFVR
jgi:hypothetical protein